MPRESWPLASRSIRAVTAATAAISGSNDMTMNRLSVRVVTVLAVAVMMTVVLPADAFAHGVSGKDAVYLQGLTGAAIGPLMYLGAKHMVTGYDHLLFLIG